MRRRRRHRRRIRRARGGCVLRIRARDRQLASLAPVVAAVVGFLVSQQFTTEPLGIFVGNAVAISSRDLTLVGVLGLLAGLFGIAVMRAVAVCEKLFARRPIPAALRPLFGGIFVGICAWVSPQVMSSGHGALHLTGLLDRPLRAIGIVLLLKSIASVVSLGSGFRGGLFFTSLLLGALAGHFFAGAVVALWPGIVLDTRAYALIGGAAAVVAVAWPLIDQMEPDRSTLAAGGPVEVDLTKLGPGQQIMAQWRGKPVFIVNRTPDALKTLRDAKLLDQLADPNSQQNQQPPYADNWHRSAKPEYLVLVGICTHLGCIPKFYPQPSATDPTSNWLGGYFCPCHGSKYNLAGRVFRGVPAPYNLPVPPYAVVNNTQLRIGENPAGVIWDFGSIQQV